MANRPFSVKTRRNLIRKKQAPVAQSVEHLPFKQRVAGSIPARCTSEEFASDFGSLRFAWRLNCKGFWAKKSVGDFVKYGSSRCF